MSYREALEAAGANVIAFEQFGSYQGDWYALCEKDDERFWISDCYGSCSVCDAFEAECPNFDPDTYEDLPPDIYHSKIAAFGARYLDDRMTDAQALAKASENIDWDSDAEQMVAFVKAHCAQATQEQGE